MSFLATSVLAKNWMQTGMQKAINYLGEIVGGKVAQTEISKRVE